MFRWAIVFKYSEVNIAAGATVTFKNHPSRAPVVWLVDGEVTIDGTVSLNGATGHSQSSLHALSEPGPGGFRGGSASHAGVVPTPGLGPGGASYGDGSSSGSGGSYGTSGGTGGCGSGVPGPIYGGVAIHQLIGGSAGASGHSNNDAGGGAGAGAILIASEATVEINGQVRANGGDGGTNNTVNGNCDSFASGDGGGGAGGAIRIVSDIVVGTGTLRALRGDGVPNDGVDNSASGGLGRIRVEANLIELVDQGSPAYTIGLAGDTALIFSPAFPSVRIVSVDGQSVPTDPRADFNFPTQDVAIAQPGPLKLYL